jgi:hypothetical protein
MDTTNTAFASSLPKRDDREQLNRLLPEWLENMRAGLMSSQEWQNLTTVVYHSVQDRLKQNHIQFFSDLNDVEKALFIDEVERSLAHDNVYKKFQGVLSRSLDESLSNQVERELLESGSSRVNKVDMILERAAEGATRLLKRLPSEKSIMRIMLNHEFPGPLRKQVWSMFLGHPEARQKYERDVVKSRMSTISDRDADISNKCQTLIDTKFPELETHRISTLISLMKTTLSYYEVVTQRELEEVNYYLCLPLAHIFCAVNTEASSVIEAYLALMELPRPKFMSSITTFLSESLEKLDKELYEHIAQINATATTSISGVTTETYISNLLEPHILRCFVGTVSIPVCCYIWDQALMLGSFDKMIPNFAITIMILLREQLLASPTTQQLERTISVHSSTITERKLQALAENSFMGDLRIKLGIKRDFAGDLYDAIDYEQNEFSQNVPGLDQSMDWESFAITSPIRAGRKALSTNRRGQTQATSSLQQQFLQAQQTKSSYAAQTYKPDDVMATKRRFDDHVNQRALKREEKEAKKLQKRRRRAVEDAEEELAIAEEEREAELHTTNIAKKKELLARREAFEARRREHERDLKEREAKAMKLAHDERQKMSDVEKKRLEIQAEYDTQVHSRERDRIARNEENRLRRRGDMDDSKVPYLGADDAPIMKLRLKRSDGTEHKCEIRALVDGDTQDDARVRVEYILQKEQISLDRANKVIKALLTFSKKKTQYKADWSPQKSSRSSRVSTPRSSGRNTPSKSSKSADPTQKFNSNVLFHASDIGLTFDMEKDGDGKSVCKVLHVAHSSEAAAKIWKGDKLLKIGANDLEPDATLADIRKILDETKRPTTLHFEKTPPYLGSTKAAIFTTLMKDNNRQKVKLNIRSLVEPDNELHAEQRAAWYCMINNVLDVDKIKRALIDFSKKNGYTPPPAPRIKTPPKVKIDRKKEKGEFDLYFAAGPMGMSIDHHHGSENVHVIDMAKDGQAMKFNKIKINDIVVLIGDVVVLGKSTSEVKELIGKHERPLRIRFRHENGLDDDEDKNAQAEKDQMDAKAKKEAEEKAANERTFNNNKQYEVETSKDGKILFNGAPPLVAAIHAVMKGLQLIAFGDDTEQEQIHAEIEQEDKFIFEDFDSARTKIWGNKLNDNMINAFSSAQHTKYKKLLPKMQELALKNYKKRMDAMIKEAKKR